MKSSRRYQESSKKISKGKIYSLNEAVELIKSDEKDSFKKIKITFSLNWTNQKAVFKGKVILPYPVSPKGKLVVVDENISKELSDKLKENDFVEILKVDQIQKIISEKKKSNWGFKKILAFSGSENNLKSLEKLISPLGIFPNKKNGSLIDNDEKMIEEVNKFKLGERIIKTDKGGNIHSLLGNTELNIEQLKDNYKKLIHEVSILRPTNWKGDFIKSITLSTIMGPGIKTSIIK